MGNFRTLKKQRFGNTAARNAKKVKLAEESVGKSVLEGEVKYPIVGYDNISGAIKVNKGFRQVLYNPERVTIVD